MRFITTAISFSLLTSITLPASADSAPVLHPMVTASTNAHDADGIPWNIDRLDAFTGLNGSFDRTYQGEGSRIYIMDSGVYGEHQEFTGRVLPGYSAIIEDASADVDCDGHGTHVAGIAAGATVGVAPQATIIPVQVFNCKDDIYVEDIEEGLLWIAEDVASHGNRAVVNISLGGGKAKDLDYIFQRLMDAGVGIVVSAGNDSLDACTATVTDLPDAVVVASSRIHDTFSSFSNFGSCVDVIAPGQMIRSAGLKSPTYYMYQSGTSMSSPHVSGVIALFMERYNLNGAEAAKMVQEYAVSGRIRNLAEGTVNRSLFCPPAGDALVTVTTPLAGEDATDWGTGKIHWEADGAVAHWTGAADTEATLILLRDTTVLAEYNVPANARIALPELEPGMTYIAEWTVSRLSGETLNGVSARSYLLLTPGGFYLVDTEQAHPFAAWIKRISDDEVKFYAKNIPVGLKVQFYADHESFTYTKEIAWKRFNDREEIPEGFYLVRTYRLLEGMNRLYIRADARLVGKMVTYTKKSETED